MDLNDKIARLDDAERDTFEVLRERFDAGESLILAEKVTAFEAEVYKTAYEGFIYNKLAPVVSDGPGLEAVGYYSQDQAGKAKFIADDDDDLPNLNAKMKKHTLPIREFGAAYGWTLRELQKFSRMGLPVENDMAMQAREAMERLLDDTFFQGGLNGQVPGILTNASKYTEVAMTNPATKWSAETTDNLMQDLARIVDGVYQGSKRTWRANSVVLPVELMRVLTTRFISGTDTTILDSFLSSPTYKDVEFFDTDMFYSKNVTLASGAKTSKNIILAYYRSPQVLKYKVPVPFFQHPLERTGRKFHREVTGEIAGIEIKNATAFSVAVTPPL
ncbi:MAG: DUF2184 domain-containing protein [Candidatus Sericytochromatia bacterium]|nr:DUF2184 domain-containing protein [Candidatus Sericytochromatia bacterium]